MTNPAHGGPDYRARKAPLRRQGLCNVTIPPPGRFGADLAPRMLFLQTAEGGTPNQNLAALKIGCSAILGRRRLFSQTDATRATRHGRVRWRPVGSAVFREFLAPVFAELLGDDSPCECKV